MDELVFQRQFKMELVQPIDNVTYVVEKRRKIAFPHYSTLASRLDSFNNESHYDYFTKNKQVLAEAGFYSTGYSDSTVCYYCGGGVRDWEEDDSSQCAICLTSKREILFFPCKHFGTCVECSLRLEKCITCRAPITGMLKIFLV